MTDIPADIQKVAEIAVFAFETRIQGGEFEGLDPNGTEARDALKAEIAKAINAERERCAKRLEAIAATYLPGGPMDAKGGLLLGAAAIRSSQPSPPAGA